jgi:hypothetical protein
MDERRFPPPVVTWSSKPVQVGPAQAKSAMAAGMRPSPVPQPVQRPAPPAVVQHKAASPPGHGGGSPSSAAGRMRPPPVVQALPVVQAKTVAWPATGVVQPFHPGRNPLDGLSEREIRQARRKVAAEARRSGTRVTGDRIHHAVLEHRKAVRQALDPNGEHSDWHIPQATWVIHKVGASYYKFYNDIDGYIDFDTAGKYAAGDMTEDGKAVPPATVYAAMPYAPGVYTVNIFHSTKKGTDYMVNPTTAGISEKTLKQNNRSVHDKVADDLRGSPKPAGYTWHHHKTKGRMDLVKTTVHAAFAHRGGFSLWGRK